MLRGLAEEHEREADDHRRHDRELDRLGGIDRLGVRRLAAREGDARQRDGHAGPLQQAGALAVDQHAGKYRDESDTTAEGASPRAGQVSEYLTPKGRTLLSTLDRIAAEYDVPVATISLAWLRQQQTVAAPIASARNTEQLQALLRSLTLTLSDSDLLQLSVASQ